MLGAVKMIKLQNRKEKYMTLECNFNDDNKNIVKECKEKRNTSLACDIGTKELIHFIK